MERRQLSEIRLSNAQRHSLMAVISVAMVSLVGFVALAARPEAEPGPSLEVGTSTSTVGVDGEPPAGPSADGQRSSGAARFSADDRLPAETAPTEPAPTRPPTTGTTEAPTSENPTSETTESPTTDTTEPPTSETTEPTVTVPTVTEPTVTKPTVPTVTITLPTITVPTFTVPTLTVPTITVPTVTGPTITGTITATQPTLTIGPTVTIDDLDD